MFTLIVLSLILVTAITLSTTTLIERKASTITRSSAAAIQGADSGLEYVLRQFRLHYDAGLDYDQFVDLLHAENSAIECDSVNGDYYTMQLTEPDQEIRIVAISKNSSGEDISPVSCKAGSGIELPLEKIYAFKAIGLDRIAARALRVDLGIPIERGIVAFWDFEDYQDLWDIEGDESAMSFASDRSINGNTAYLCRGHDGPNDCRTWTSGEDMNPGPDETKTDFYSGISWRKEGVAKSGIDDSEHWAMEFNLNEDDTPSITTPYPIGSPTPSYDGEYLLVEDDDDKTLNFGTGDFSVSLWVRPTEDTLNMKLIQKGEIANNKNHWSIARWSDDNQLKVFFNDGSSPYIAKGGLAEIKKDEWTHIVVTFNRDGNAVVYRNGSGTSNDFDISSKDQSIDTNNNVRIGVNNVKPGNYFIGQMDDIRIYNRVLSETDVITLCRQGDDFGFPGACPSLP